MNQKFQQKQRVSPIDVDIYINSIHKLENQEELEHVLRKFRSSKFTIDTFDSTHHAVCRFYLHNHKVDRLLEILNNRYEYGIFPDTFCYNMILNFCLKNNQFENAFETAKLMMLQEYSGNDLSKILSFQALQKVFHTGFFGLNKIEEPKKAPVEGEEGEEEEAKAEEVPEDDDEVEYVRVPFLKNPYFDDHFDLTDKVKIWGKSLYFFGSEFLTGNSSIEDRILCNNAKIMGLIAFEKFDKLDKVLGSLGSEVEIVPETLKLIEIKRESLKETPEALETAEKYFDKIKNYKKSSKTMAELCENLLKNIEKFEHADVEDQKRNFAEFEKNRIQVLKSQIERILHEQKLQNIQDKKKELEEKKRLYYFFENFPQHEIDFVNAEKKIKELQENAVVDDDYMPPERR